MDSKQLGELVHKARSGDNKSLEILLNEFERFIYYESNRFVKSFPVEYGIDDLMQLGRLTIWNNLDKCILDKNYSIRAFFCRCIRNGISTEWHKTKAKKRIHYYSSLSLDKSSIESGESFGDLLPDLKITSLDDYLIDKEKVKMIKNAKQFLPKRQHKALDLWSVGYKSKEIALLMNTSRNAADLLLVRAKGKIRSDLKNMQN